MRYGDSNFRHRGLERLFVEDTPRGVSPAMAPKIKRMLFALPMPRGSRHGGVSRITYLPSGAIGVASGASPSWQLASDLPV